MHTKIMLCIDSYTLEHPEFMGLAGENVRGQSWLIVQTDPFEARRRVCENASIKEAWVISSDDIDGINLAAALKQDGCEQVVYVSFDSLGSAASRCEAASIGYWGQGTFLQAYAQKKDALRVDPEPSGLFEPEEPAWKLPQRTELVQGENKLAETTQSAASRIMATQLIPKAKDTAADAFVLSVVSGSGGSGKSTIALLAACAFQQAGKKTLLLDADLQFGDLRFLSGIESALDVSDALEHPERFDELIPQSGLPALLASPKQLEHSELIMGRTKELIAYLKSRFDVIVINTGAFWSEQHAQIIESSDRVFFLLDQRPSSVRSCNHALDLCRRCGIAVQAFTFVLNFCTRQALLTSMDASCALQGATVHELKNGGREVGELLAAGLPLEVIKANNALYTSMSKLLEETTSAFTAAALPHTRSESSTGKGMLKSLLRKRRAA